MFDLVGTEGIFNLLVGGWWGDGLDGFGVQYSYAVYIGSNKYPINAGLWGRVLMVAGALSFELNVDVY